MSSPVRRAAEGVLGGTAFGAAVVPAFELCRKLYQVMSYDSGAPDPYVVAGERLPTGLVVACAGIAIAAAVAAVLVAVRGDRTGPGLGGAVPAASA